MSTEEVKKDLSYTQNRELSWLEFNRRVLFEALEDDVPNLEKLKFISIFVSNLDEFFMVRVGSLTDAARSGKIVYDNKTGMTHEEQLKAIYEKMPELYALKDKIFQDVEEKLRKDGVAKLSYAELSPEEKEYVDMYFEKNILPFTSPMVLNSHHPFPFISNNNLAVIVEMQDKKGENFIGLIQNSSNKNTIVTLPGKDLRYIEIQEIVRNKLKDIFKFKINNSALICVTRNADIALDEELDDFDDDFRKYMKKQIKKRNRLEPVRLEISGNLSDEVLEYLLSNLNLERSMVFHSESPLSMSYVFSLFDKLSPEKEALLTYPKYAPISTNKINMDESIIEQVIKEDKLLFFPFQSMDPFLAMLKEASNDPNVTSIKITIYRLSSISKVAEYLANAAENGKEVIAIMELRARFDEDNNINWSERLEQAGCTVMYGFEDYKIHSKICLITRMINGKVQYISQFGTGNYNEKTAKLYTDLSLITANQELGQDANEFFKNIMISNLDGNYKHLMVAPAGLKPGLINLFDEQIALAKEGKPALIRLKCNSVTEREIIDKISEASNAGVKIIMNVRGICCILPGIEGKTDNLTISSTVGRYLEHPRIYIFGQDEDAKVYISSADLMTRNLTRRVEIACPIYDPDIKQTVIEIAKIIFNDRKKARFLQSDGSYIRLEEENAISSQEEFMKITREKYQAKVEHKIEKKKRQVVEHEKAINTEEKLEEALSKMSFWEKLKKLFLS